MAGFNYYSGVQGQQQLPQGQMGGAGQSPMQNYSPGAYMGAGVVKQSMPMQSGQMGQAVAPSVGAKPGSTAPLGMMAPGMTGSPSTMQAPQNFNDYTNKLYGQQGSDAFYLSNGAPKDLYNPLSSNTAVQNSALAGGGYVNDADIGALTQQRQNINDPYFASLKAMGIDPNQEQSIIHAGYDPRYQNSVANYYSHGSQGFTNGINPGSDWKTMAGVTYGTGSNGQRTGQIDGLNFNVTDPGAGTAPYSPTTAYNHYVAGASGDPWASNGILQGLNTYNSSFIDPTMYGYQNAKPLANGSAFSMNGGNYYTPYGYQKGQ